MRQKIEEFILFIRLHRYISLQRRFERLRADLALTKRFSVGRHEVGDLEVLHYLSSGGYDYKRFIESHPAIKKKFSAIAADYARAEKHSVRIKERR
jgi:hypothetical protein